MQPALITVNFCFDGNNLPPENTTVLCIFSEVSANIVRYYYDYCTLISFLASPEDKFWVKHNSLEKSRVYPQAWFGLPDTLPSMTFMAALKDQKQLTFQLSTPWMNVP